MVYKLKWVGIGMIVGLLLLMTGSLFSKEISQLRYNIISTFVQNSKSITIGRATDSLSLDPASTIDMGSARVAVNIFEGLVKYEQNEIVPALAKRWSVSEDGLTWTFYLEKGILFHDDTPFNAEAVAFNFDRWMNEDNPYHSDNFQFWNIIFGISPSVVKDVQALSDDIVEIQLNSPYAPFLSTLAMPAFSIASPEAVIKYHEDFKYKPVGTGPFKFSSWNEEGTIELERYIRYWGDPAKVSKLIFKTIPDSGNRIDQMISGQIQMISNLTPDESNALENSPHVKLLKRPLSSVGYLALNLETPELTDPNFRKLLYSKLHNEMDQHPLFAAFSKPAQAFIPPGIWGGREGMQNNQLSDAEIRATAANYDMASIHLKLLAPKDRRPYYPEPHKLALFIKQTLETLGMEIEIVEMPWGEFLSSLDQHNYDLLMTGWVADVIDPDNFLYTFFASENISKGSMTNYALYSNPEVDELLRLARQTSDRSFRESLYGEAQNIIYDDIPGIPLTNMINTMAVHDSITGFTTDISGLDRLHSVDYTEVSHEED